jgi:hypothetical protein
MADMDYRSFRDTYMFGAMSSQTGRPLMFADRDRDKALMLGPLPDDVYIVYGEYQAGATRMAANTDIPANGNFPDEYHMMIVHGAVMKYAAYEGTSALYEAHRTEYRRILRALEKDQLDDVEQGRSLA